jgi:chromosome segregation ATPase
VVQTMLDVMRNHTELIRGVQKEITDVAALVGHIANEAADNKRQLKLIDETVTKNKSDIEELFNLLRGMRIEVDVIKKQVNELIVLKQEVQSQRDEMNEMKHKFEAHANNMVVYINKTTHAVAALDSKSNDVQLQLRELKDYVEHFGDNIVLASSQVTVESSAGYAERPISLLEVLKRCNLNINDLQSTCHDQEDKITANKDAINTKAGDECLFDIQTLQKKVSNIENHLKREEEQGISVSSQCFDMGIM